MHRLFRVVGCAMLFMGPILFHPFNLSKAFCESGDSVSADHLSHQTSTAAEWWTFPGVELKTTEKSGAQSPAFKVNGEGRLLLSASRSPVTVQAGRLNVQLQKDAKIFVDHVGDQTRIMVLSGNITVHDGHRTFPLFASLQVVDSPEKVSGYFIDDGIYRRPPLKVFEEHGRKEVLRQFYLEQTVYNDPLLRTLYSQGGVSRRMVNRLNKTGAILRQTNGTTGYIEGQI